MTPFHSEIYNEDSSDQEPPPEVPVVKEKSIGLQPESSKNLGVDYLSISKTDGFKKQQTDNSNFLPPVNLSKNYADLSESKLFKTSIAPPKKLESSAVMFTSPKKKNPKHRRRLVDVEREEKRKKRKRTTLKTAERIQSEKHVDQVTPYDKQVESKEVKANTPIHKKIEESTLTHFAHSLLEKMSRKGDGTSTKSNRTPDSNSKSKKKSWKRKHHHKKSQRRRTVMKEDFGDSQMKAEEFSLKKSKKPKDSSLELGGAVNTWKSIKSNIGRRRSKTGVEIKGIALNDKHYGNFVVDEESSTS